MKKMMMVLSLMVATAFTTTANANERSQYNEFASKNAVRTLESIADCKVVEKTAYEVLIESGCVDEKFQLAIAHLNTDTYISQIAERIEHTWNYYNYAGSFYGKTIDTEVKVYALKYTVLGKAARKAYGYSTTSLQDFIDAAVQEIEMFRR